MELLERERYLTDLTQWLHTVGKGGCIVLVGGEAGIGKTSLLQAFSNQQRQARVLWGACDALFTPRPFAPLHDIARQTQGALWAAVNSGASHNAIFNATLDELERGEDVLVVFEDMHWADEATLDLLKFLGRRIQHTRAMLVVTYRDDEVGTRHPLRFVIGDLPHANTRRMPLFPLSESAVSELARQAGRPAKDLHSVTGGNPFFVREVLANLDERVPETVRDAVLARLVRCSPATRELAELVSISPARTEAWLIESMLGPDQTAADEAVARGVLVVQNDTIGFRHELARLAVHGTIPQARICSMHERVLQALAGRDSDLSQLAHHATFAHNAAAILRYAPLAAKEAARFGAHREAAAHLGAALGYRASLPMADQAELLEQHARECSLANQTRLAITSATAAIEAWRQVGNVEAQSRVLSFTSQEYRTIGDKARADECVAMAIDLLEAFPPCANLAMAYSARALLAVNRGWDKEGLEYGQRALALAREFGDRATQSHALCNIGAALLGTGDHAGYAPLIHSLSLAIEHHLEDVAARAYRTMLFYAVLIHDFSRADNLFRAGMAYCEEHGIFSHSAYMRAYYTPCELDRGKWAEAARASDELLRSAEITGVQQRITILVTLALVRLRRGDPGVDALLDEAVELALPTCELNRTGRVAAARAERAWLRGDLDQVAREATIGLDHVCGHTAPWIKGELLLWLSRAHAIDLIPDDIAEPWRLMLTGRWEDAATAWEGIGMPYEQALALAEGSEEALRRALTILDGLSAAPLASIVRRRLRERGIRGIPRGPNEATRANPAGLTAKEIEILTLLAHGNSNAQLASQLHRSTKTIDHHVSAILEKLDVRSRTQAVAAAFALGVIAAPGDSATYSSS